MSKSFVNCDSFFLRKYLSSIKWQLGQIYTRVVKISSVYDETEQTSRVSALAGDLPEK